jgi:NAD(P)-dependent dehydrogenase (short-subunit alcohol dehydrogenase family)
MLSEKIIVISGGAGLLGRRFCEAVAANGGTAVVADVKLEAAQQVALEIGARHNDRARAAVLDITHKDSILTLIADIRKTYGRIDALVNNAYPRNANYGRKLEDVTYADFCENIGLHVGGYFLAAQQFAAVFREQGHGNIVNISSIYGSVAPRFELYAGTTMTMPVEYAAIKAAVNHLTRYMAAYFKGTGIRVNCLSPGGIADRQPQTFLEAYREQCSSKGMLDPDDMLGALIFLLSDASHYVNGQNLLVDDGFALGGSIVS